MMFDDVVDRFLIFDEGADGGQSSFQNLFAFEDFLGAVVDGQFEVVLRSFPRGCATRTT